MRLLSLLAAVAALAACGERAPASAPPAQTEAQAIAPTQVMGAPAARADEAGDGVDDTRIVASILQALAADAELGQFMIDVVSKEGLVVLSGVAPSEEARERASGIALATPQVHDLSNQMTLRRG